MACIGICEKGQIMGRKNDYPFSMRASYWFDNRMAEGFWPKVKLLLIVTVIFVVIIGAIAALAGGIEKAGDTFVRTLMYALGKGGALELSKDGASPVYFVMMLLTILYCIFFTSILIGLISNALKGKVDELGKGQSRVIENGHTLILGFNEATFVLVTELVEANLNQKDPQTVVILGNVDSAKMVDELRARIGKASKHPNTRIICRTGFIYRFSDLTRCSIETSRSIIVNGKSDFETVKAIMACSHILSKSENDQLPYIVAVVRGDENMKEATIAAQNVGLAENLEFLSINDTLARIMVHTSRQPGLSNVFTELFNYSGNEIYIMPDDPSFPKLYGRSLEEVNRMLKTAFVVGKRTAEGAVVIGNPLATTFEKGDSLIVVQEDDDKLVVSEEPAPTIGFTPGSVIGKEQISALVLGVRPILESILLEYAEYLHAGSTIHVADKAFETMPYVGPNTLASLEAEGINVKYHCIDIDSRNALGALLDSCQPDCVVVLANHDTDPEIDDELTVRRLIYLREFRMLAAQPFSITSEICSELNKELVEATGPDDFIISSHISALLMAQISQQREIADVFSTLLASEGYEVYMKRSSWYIEPGSTVDLMTASRAVAQRGEVLIGTRLKKNGAYETAEINPPKYKLDMQTTYTHTFCEDDYFVVLAEDGYYND